MFIIAKLNGDIQDLKYELGKLRQEFKQCCDDFRELQSSMNNKLAENNNAVEARLISFHKEITDKYFSTLERILKVHSETSLITALVHQVNQKDLGNLRSTLLKPFLEEKWNCEEKEKGEKTEKNLQSLGQRLIVMRRNLHEEMLKNGREEKPVEELKGKIDILNLIIGDTL